MSPPTLVRRISSTFVLLVLIGSATAVIGSPQSQTTSDHGASQKSPSSRLVVVNGARLEYLDWGGTGAPLVFLGGLGATPYVFNDVAPEFISSFHCFGLTRRGFGKSEQTKDGYELDNLVFDIVSFARSLGLRNITLIGHSYGGTEAVRASELYPDLIRRVILLDTA